MYFVFNALGYNTEHSKSFFKFAFTTNVIFIKIVSIEAMAVANRILRFAWLVVEDIFQPYVVADQWCS